MLNYRVAMKKTMEKGLSAPALTLDAGFLMYEEMSSEHLQEEKRQLQELLLRGIFSLSFMFIFKINFLFTLFISSSSCSVRS